MLPPARAGPPVFCQQWRVCSPHRRTRSSEKMATVFFNRCLNGSLCKTSPRIAADAPRPPRRPPRKPDRGPLYTPAAGGALEGGDASSSSKARGQFAPSPALGCLLFGRRARRRTPQPSPRSRASDAGIASRARRRRRASPPRRDAERRAVRAVDRGAPRPSRTSPSRSTRRARSRSSSPATWCPPSGTRPTP